ncbi:MAG TPA: amino acid--[acyl-carrier-protein] ligase [Gemmatimonadaceae bacterium]|nr:amino acid--[acyl-carrier-protein] ligase [Gemmatimonadaceae bacterium]
MTKTRLEAITSSILQPTAANGVQGRTGPFEQVIAGLTALITKHREPGTEILRFPPVMSRALLEKSGYLKSFPHLLGVVSSMHGTEADIRSLVEGRGGDRKWVDALTATDLVLTPAACYPVYPIVAARGNVPVSGTMIDVESYCFRRETSSELGRMQAFRMREYVCIAAPQTALAFRERWKARAEQLAKLLALPFKLVPASDPFFGRAGKLMAINQVEQALKFELVIPVNSEEEPTACMSFNYHQDHFGTTWGLRTDDGAIAHTACAAFGMDRLGVALFATHGLDLDAWPTTVREALSL